MSNAKGEAGIHEIAMNENLMVNQSRGRIVDVKGFKDGGRGPDDSRGDNWTPYYSSRGDGPAPEHQQRKAPNDLDNILRSLRFSRLTPAAYSQPCSQSDSSCTTRRTLPKPHNGIGLFRRGLSAFGNIRDRVQPHQQDNCATIC